MLPEIQDKNKNRSKYRHQLGHVYRPLLETRLCWHVQYPHQHKYWNCACKCWVLDVCALKKWGDINEKNLTFVIERKEKRNSHGTKVVCFFKECKGNVDMMQQMQTFFVLRNANGESIILSLTRVGNTNKLTLKQKYHWNKEFHEGNKIKTMFSHL